MRIKDLRISTQLIAGFALVLILAASQTFYAIYGMSKVNSNADLIGKRWLVGTRLSSALDASLNRLRALDYQYVMTFDEEKRRDLEELLQVTMQHTEEEVNGLVQLFSDSEQKDALDALKTSWEQYKAQQIRIVKLAKEGNDQDALIVLKEEALEIYEAMNTGLAASRAFAMDGSERAQAENASIRSTVLGGTLLALTLTVVLGVLTAATLTRRIGGGFRHVTQIAMAVAEGDLSTKFQANSHDEFGLLLNSLRHMQQALADLVQRVRRGSDAVSSASVEIAEGNQDLSARTENQASALQQTAATMEELGATVKQNAANAQQANQLAQQASTVAVQGGEAVDQVVTMMKSISESSRKISDIINVIDGIAFQTNILALNAAVEAARAGEQGRGFAVVAGEVRSLAQRSAEAAKEIKTLISDSVSRVEQGAARADQAGGTMDEVVAAIRRVSDVVAEISAASVQQSSGVGQVGEAITNMDQVTQQNAALVEEMAAAALSLRGQATELVQAVATFKLEDHQREQPPMAAALTNSKLPDSKPPEGQEPNADALPDPAQSLLQLASA